MHTCVLSSAQERERRGIKEVAQPQEATSKTVHDHLIHSSIWPSRTASRTARIPPKIKSKPPWWHRSNQELLKAKRRRRVERRGRRLRQEKKANSLRWSRSVAVWGADQWQQGETKKGTSTRNRSRLDQALKPTSKIFCKIQKSGEIQLLSVPMQLTWSLHHRANIKRVQHSIYSYSQVLASVLCILGIHFCALSIYMLMA